MKLFNASFLLSILLGPEDGGDIFLWNVGRLHRATPSLITEERTIHGLKPSWVATIARPRIEFDIYRIIIYCFTAKRILSVSHIYFFGYNSVLIHLFDDFERSLWFYSLFHLLVCSYFRQLLCHRDEARGWVKARWVTQKSLVVPGYRLHPHVQALTHNYTGQFTGKENK
jgi:hypothetical protein